MKHDPSQRKKRGNLPKGAVDQHLQAWALHRFESKQQTEIAKILGVNRNTIGSWIKEGDKKYGLKQGHKDQENRLYALRDDAFTSIGKHCEPGRADESNPPIAALNLKASSTILAATGDVVPKKQLDVNDLGAKSTKELLDNADRMSQRIRELETGVGSDDDDS